MFVTYTTFPTEVGNNMKLSDLFQLLVSTDRVSLSVGGKPIFYDVKVVDALHSSTYDKYKDRPILFIFGSDVGRISITITPEEVTQ